MRRDRRGATHFEIELRIPALVADHADVERVRPIGLEYAVRLGLSMPRTLILDERYSEQYWRTCEEGLRASAAAHSSADAREMRKWP